MARGSVFPQMFWKKHQAFREADDKPKSNVKIYVDVECPLTSGVGYYTTMIVAIAVSDVNNTMTKHTRMPYSHIFLELEAEKFSHNF